MAVRRTFRDYKQLLATGSLEVTIVVHPLAVERELEQWPECDERERKWFAIGDAAKQVELSELAAIILQLGTRASTA